MIAIILFSVGIIACVMLKNLCVHDAEKEHEEAVKFRKENTED